MDTLCSVLDCNIFIQHSSGDSSERGKCRKIPECVALMKCLNHEHGKDIRPAESSGGIIHCGVPRLGLRMNKVKKKSV